ncbi:MAG: site-specific integrase, partial [Oscillospiraceae bacterium]
KCMPNDDGSINELYAYGKTNKDATEKAKRKIDAFIAEKEKERLKTFERFTVFRYMSEYVRHASLSIKSSSNQRNIDTLKTFKKDAYLLDFVSKSIITIDKETLFEVVEYLCNHSGNSLLKKQEIMISNAFDIAFEDELISRNLFKMLFKKLPKSKIDANKGISAFSLSEQQKLVPVLAVHIDKISKGEKLTAIQQTAVILVIEYYTGMRPGEIAALQKQDIDFDNHILKVHYTITQGENYTQAIGSTKTKNGCRNVYMLPVVEDIIKLYIDAYNRSKAHAPINSQLEDFLFLAIRTGTMLKVSSINANFKAIFEKTFPDVNICQYMLRHTFASNCYAYGIRDNTISSILGHS